jgi:hypothetical protein
MNDEQPSLDSHPLATDSSGQPFKPFVAHFIEHMRDKFDREIERDTSLLANTTDESERTRLSQSIRAARHGRALLEN